MSNYGVLIPLDDLLQQGSFIEDRWDRGEGAGYGITRVMEGGYVWVRHTLLFYMRASARCCTLASFSRMDEMFGDVEGSGGREGRRERERVGRGEEKRTAFNIMECMFQSCRSICLGSLPV